MGGAPSCGFALYLLNRRQWTGSLPELKTRADRCPVPSRGPENRLSPSPFQFRFRCPADRPEPSSTRSRATRRALRTAKNTCEENGSLCSVTLVASPRPAPQHEQVQEHPHRDRYDSSKQSALGPAVQECVPTEDEEGRHGHDRSEGDPPSKTHRLRWHSGLVYGFLPSGLFHPKIIEGCRHHLSTWPPLKKSAVTTERYDRRRTCGSAWSCISKLPRKQSQPGDRKSRVGFRTSAACGHRRT